MFVITINWSQYRSSFLIWLHFLDRQFQTKSEQILSTSVELTISARQYKWLLSCCLVFFFNYGFISFCYISVLVEGKSKSILVSLVSKFSNINFNMATVKGGRSGDPVIY